MAGFLIGIGKAGEVAERSPAVYSANLKEDILCKKKLHVLNRSERSVVHQVKVDQKVLYRRFQAKLVRSKLAFARIMGHKDVEKDLRSKSLGGLNTDVAANSDEDYAFLGKLEYRPCTASSFTPRSSNKTGRMPRTPPREPLKKTKFGRSMSLDALGALPLGKNGGQKTVQTNREKIPAATVRPATTAGARVLKEFLLQSQQQIKATESKESSHHEDEVSQYASTADMTSSSPRESGADSHRASTVADDKDDEKNVDQKSRPKTVTIVPHVTTESPPVSPRRLSRRSSRGADFFQEHEKIDIVQVQLAQAKSMDHTPKVRGFCDMLDHLECAQYKPNTDYYSTRLQLSVNNDKRSQTLPNVPGTPEEEYKRSMGNIFVKSLTMPSLDLNFVSGKVATS